jgi:2-oxoglutarate ferredoxin oxidoreductase subunit alpha
VDRLREQGVALDVLRLRAFPFDECLDEFLRTHERCFVVEQNRDAQLRSLIQLETGVARDRLPSVLDYGGVPLSPERVVAGILSHLDGWTGAAAPPAGHRTVATRAQEVHA